MENILRRLFGRETRANDGVVSADWLTGKTSMTSISALEAMYIPAVSAAVGFICGIVSQSALTTPSFARVSRPNNRRNIFTTLSPVAAAREKGF